MNNPARDLVAYVADSHLQQTLEGLFSRPEALNVRPFQHDIFVASNDPQCRIQGVAFLRSLHRKFRNALLIFDHEGSGVEHRTSAEELERELDEELRKSGWADRAATIVIEPELEAWVWSPSVVVDRELGWSGKLPGLRPWLQDRSFLTDSHAKPQRPKEALHAALKESGKKPSGAIFRAIAAKASLKGCQDRAFNRLLVQLRAWFPSEPEGEAARSS